MRLDISSLFLPERSPNKTVTMRPRITRPRDLLLHILLLVVLILPFAHATTPASLTPNALSLDPWRIPKVLTLGLSAMTSFSTGMVSLQLDIMHVAPASDLISVPVRHMALRLACSSTMVILAVLYPLWFLTHSAKSRRFLEGICITGAFCWLCVRLVGSSGEEQGSDSIDDVGKDGRDKFIFLDKLNLYLFAAVTMGVLNAEKRLLSSFVRDGEAAAAEDRSSKESELERGRRRDQSDDDGSGDTSPAGSPNNLQGPSHVDTKMERQGAAADRRRRNGDDDGILSPGFSSHVADIVMGIV